MPYDPDPHREKMRGWIAVGLLGLLAFVIVAAFVTLWLTLWFQSPAPSEILRVLEIILGPVVSLVGAVTGFYYGSVRERR